MKDPGVVDVGIAHAGGESGGPRAFEAELRCATAWHEFGPGLAVALDQQTVAAWRPTERANRAVVIQLARESGLIHDPQRAGGSICRAGGEGKPALEPTRRTCREANRLVADELVAIDVERGRVDRNLIRGVGRQELGWRDDR